MPAHRQSLAITDAYRRRLVALRDAAIRMAHTNWQATVTPADFDASLEAFARRAVPALATAQAAGVRLSAAYLARYTSSELNRPVRPLPFTPERYVGVARSGKSLIETFQPIAITMKVAVGKGSTPDQAVEHGLGVATRLAASESLGAARAALTDGISEDDRIVGWSRVTSGGCGACLAAATRTYGAEEPMLVHDNCQCAAEPIVGGAPDRYQRPDGQAIFDAMSVEQQDNLLGPDKAELIRTGAAPMAVLIDVNHMTAIPDQITESSLERVQSGAPATVPA